ncbi:MAG: hypothetical protein MUE44_02150 [Oscillatoriaceae cyanobacterium Prado104]|jgi:hypothetical protein|nr:hypothetical protein [Oscillatoriaceae cyanobacterium Prado104]
MQYDEFDLLYVLLPHGWSTCILYLGDRTRELYISHVFGDPIGDFIDATIAILKGASAVEFIWWDEPGGNRWQIIRNPQQHHQVTVIITEFSSAYGKPIDREKILVEFEIKISHFSTVVYFQMKKIAALLREKSFEKNRSGEFPYAEFQKLESFFNA